MDEDEALSSNLALIKDIPSLYKSSSFILQNSNSKGSKKCDYSINPDFTEKLKPYRILSFHNAKRITLKLPLKTKNLRLSLKT